LSSLRRGAVVDASHVSAPEELATDSVEHRLPAAQDILLDRARILGGFWSVDIKAGQTNHVAGILPTAIGRERLVHDEESAVLVLDPEMVGGSVDESLPHSALILERVDLPTETRRLAQQAFTFASLPVRILRRNLVRIA
jgi:hypothetical protein